MALTDNLISYWKLDESSGNAADSVGSNTLSNNNSATYVTGKINNGVQTASTGSKYLSISDASQSGLDLSGDFSLSFWYKKTGSGFYIVGKHAPPSQRGYLLGYGGDGGTGPGLFLYVSSNLTAATVKNNETAFSDGVFHHIVCTFSAAAGTAKMYVDGARSGSDLTGYPTSIANNTADFMVSGFGNGGTVSDGIVDELGIWSRALTSTEVSTLYNGGSGKAYPFANTYTQTLTETVTNSDSFIKTASRTLAEAVTYTASLVRNATRLLSEAATITATGLKTVGRALVEGTASQGPFAPGTAVDDASVGTTAWTNVGNIFLSDNVYATNTGDGSPSFASHYLKATNFGFSIPSGATITGIKVDIEEKASADLSASEQALYLIRSDGSLGTTNRRVAAFFSTEAVVSHGGVTDLWGETLAASDVNNPNFGVAFSVGRTGASQATVVASVDQILMTVYYTVGGVGFSDAVVRGTGKLLIETATYAATIVRTCSKLLTDAVSFTAALIRTNGRTLAEAFGTSDSAAKVRTRAATLSDAVTYLDTALKMVLRTLAEAPAVSDLISAGRMLPVAFQEAFSGIDSLLRTGGKVLTDAVTYADSTLRAIGRALTDSATYSDVFAGSRLRLANLADSFTSSDAFSRIVSLHIALTESVLFADVRRILRNGSANFLKNVVKHASALKNAVKHSATLSTIAKHAASLRNTDKS